MVRPGHLTATERDRRLAEIRALLKNAAPAFRARIEAGEQEASA
jgi:hypothetical protein